MISFSQHMQMKCKVQICNAGDSNQVLRNRIICSRQASFPPLMAFLVWCSKGRRNGFIFLFYVLTSNKRSFFRFIHIEGEFQIQELSFGVCSIDVMKFKWASSFRSHLIPHPPNVNVASKPLFICL